MTQTNRQRTVGIAGFALAMVLAAVIAPQSAHAGTYVMRTCDVPGHGNARLGPWEVGGPYPNLASVDECASGGGIAFTFSGARRMKATSGPGLLLRRPTFGPQSTIKPVKARFWYSARLSSSGSPVSVQFVEADDDGSNKAPAYPPGGENLVTEQLLDPYSSDLYWLVLWCGVTDPAAPDCFPAHGTPLHVRGLEVTLNEDIPPSAAPLGGALLTGGPQTGARTLNYAASDPQSGIAKIEALLGETVVGSRDLTPKCAYDDFTVCPSSDEGSLQVDTRAVPNGPHALTLRLTDAANNQHTVRAPNPIEVVNSGTISERLTARFNGSSRSTVTVPFGRRVTIRGRLASPAGRGIGRARIQVFERTSRQGARQRAVGSVRTRADGSFSYFLAGGRPSRVVRIAYVPKGAGPPTSRTLHLNVRAAAILQTSLRGTLVRFGGRVVSGPLPPRGKRVLLQGKAPGYSWATFATVRTNRHGRFTGNYRLPVRRPGVKLQIRVVVPTERGYPYASYTGRPITLRVR